MVWEASTRWNVDGQWIAREIFWTEEDEADTKVGWEIIEDLLCQAENSSRPTIERDYKEFVEFGKNSAKDSSDVTLARKDGLEANEEEESSEEELERSLAAEAYEQVLAEEPAIQATKVLFEDPALIKALSEEPAIKVAKVLFAKDNFHSLGYKHKKHWKFGKSLRRIKPWNRSWRPCCHKERPS